VSGTRDLTLNITKDVLITLVVQEFMGILVAVCQQLEMKAK
jgi:hypothetical protein